MTPKQLKAEHRTPKSKCGGNHWMSQGLSAPNNIAPLFVRLAGFARHVVEAQAHAW